MIIHDMYTHTYDIERKPMQVASTTTLLKIKAERGL